MNLFSTVLSYPAPSANYRGESAENRSVIQKISIGRFEYAILSPEAIRNALRESFISFNLACNRQRLLDEDQPAVKFDEYPDQTRFVDDFFMGWLIAANKNERKEILGKIKKNGRDPQHFTFKRDSVLRINMAVALKPYRHNSVFTQSPLHVDSPWKNAESSQLLHRETVYTAYQYPFALNLEDCRDHPDWTKILLKAIGQLNNVAGNHARSYYEMAPASIVVRLTSNLVAGYNTYGFKIDKDGSHIFPEIIDGILNINKDGTEKDNPDYPGEEFFIGGKLVKDMDEKTLNNLNRKGVILERNPQRLLEKIGEIAFPNKGD